MNRDYWKRAGNAKWGMQMLAQDIWNINHKRPIEPQRKDTPPINNNILGSEQPTVTERVNSPSSNSLPPTYNYYNYNYPNNGQTTFRYMGLGRTILLILFMMIMIVFIYYVCFNPEAIINLEERIVEFCHNI